MVNATHRKDLIRVQFHCPPLNNRSDADIVCYLRVTETGLTLYYSHHVMRSRSTEKGPYEQENTIRLTLDQALRAQIEACTMLEFWSAFLRKVRVFPYHQDAMLGVLEPEMVEFGDD